MMRNDDYRTQTATAGRHTFADLARAFALFGIALVNVSLIAYPPAMGYAEAGLRSAPDRWAWFMVMAVFLFKAYSIFSCMFSVGFAHQIASAERSGASFGARYGRRLVGLLLLGVFNVVCLFFGDILILYAVLGSLLFAFRDFDARQLWRWAVFIYIVQFAIVAVAAAGVWFAATYEPEAMAGETLAMQEQAAAAYSAFRSPDFFTASAFRVQSWVDSMFFAILIQGFGVFAFFLFGLALVRVRRR